MRPIITCWCLLALVGCKSVPQSKKLKETGGASDASTKIGSAQWYKEQTAAADKGEMFENR